MPAARNDRSAGSPASLGTTAMPFNRPAPLAIASSRQRLSCS
jgi:hypothetical protein